MAIGPTARVLDRRLDEQITDVLRHHRLHTLTGTADASVEFEATREWLRQHRGQMIAWCWRDTMSA